MAGGNVKEKYLWPKPCDLASKLTLKDTAFNVCAANPFCIQEKREVGVGLNCNLSLNAAILLSHKQYLVSLQREIARNVPVNSIFLA